MPGKDRHPGHGANSMPLQVECDQRFCNARHLGVLENSLRIFETDDNRPIVAQRTAEPEKQALPVSGKVQRLDVEPAPALDIGDGGRGREHRVRRQQGIFQAPGGSRLDHTVAFEAKTDQLFA